MSLNKPQHQPFIYHVCWKDIGEEPLDEFVQRFWKREAEGTLPEKNEESSHTNWQCKQWKTQSVTTVKDIRLAFLGNL